MIAVDPRVTKTAQIADRHLAVRPRTDVTLLNAILRILLDEGLLDLERARPHVDGLDELLDHLRALDLDGRRRRVRHPARRDPSHRARPSGAPSGAWWRGRWA